MQHPSVKHVVRQFAKHALESGCTEMMRAERSVEVFRVACVVRGTQRATMKCITSAHHIQRRVRQERRVANVIS